MLTYPPPSMYLFESILSIQFVSVPIHAEPPRIREDGTGGYIAILTPAPAIIFLPFDI